MLSMRQSSTFQLLFALESLSSWSGSFYLRLTPVIAGPKRMPPGEKAKTTAWPFKTSLSGLGTGENEKRLVESVPHNGIGADSLD